MILRGGAWQIFSSQIIYFHNVAGQNIYFQADQSRIIYFLHIFFWFAIVVWSESVIKYQTAAHWINVRQDFDKESD